MSKKSKNIEFDDPKIILISAFRYALGRSSYITKVVSDEIIKNWNYLEDYDKKQIIMEIKCADNLGMHCDITFWNKILELEITMLDD